MFDDLGVIYLIQLMHDARHIHQVKHYSKDDQIFIDEGYLVIVCQV